MLRKTLLLSCGLLVGSAASIVEAGQTYYSPVKIDHGIHWAYGGVGEARYSQSFIESIYCSVNHIGNWNLVYEPSVTCVARDAGADVAVCHSEDPAHVQAVTAINETSHIFFSWQDGLCVQLTISNGSMYIE